MKQRTVWLVLLAVMGTTLLSCKKADNDHGKAHWSYEGELNPEHWGEVSETCKTGKHQSPIDIKGPFTEMDHTITMNYNPVSLDMINNGHTIQVNVGGDNTLTVDGSVYKLVQFHFHSPSEHKIDGSPMDMVAHLVHKNDAGDLAVVGVLFKKGDQNEFLSGFWSMIPGAGDETKKAADVMVDVNKLLPESRAHYFYEGSLTTPPCSEGVKWFVLTTPVTVSAEQVAAFTTLFPKSVRPVQALNDRTVMKSN